VKKNPSPFITIGPLTQISPSWFGPRILPVSGSMTCVYVTYTTQCYVSAMLRRPLNYFSIHFLLRTFAPKIVPLTGFFSVTLPRKKAMIYFYQKGKKKKEIGGSPTSFWREHAPKNTLNLKIWALLANKATVFAIRSLKLNVICQILF